MNVKPYLGVFATVVITIVAAPYAAPFLGNSTESQQTENFILDSQEIPIETAGHTYRPTASNRSAFRLDIDTDWSEQCEAALDDTAEIDNVLGGHFYFHEVAYPLHPMTSGEVQVESIPVSSGSDGEDNPIAQYLSNVGAACDGQELNHEEQAPYKGVAESAHEFSTVESYAEGELWTTFSAWAVKGYIVYVKGVNVSKEDVRAVSSAQVAKIDEEAIRIGPRSAGLPSALYYFAN